MLRLGENWFCLSQNDDDKLCLICHEDMRKSGGVQELRCAHRFHKEVKTSFTSDRLHVTVNTAWRRLSHCKEVSTCSLQFQHVPDIKSMVHEGSSFLDMHEVGWKHHLPRPETYLCGCMVSRLWGLLITMSPFGGGGWWRGHGGQSSVDPVVAVKRRLVRWGRSRTRGGNRQMDRSPRRRSSTRPVANFPCGDIADIILWMEVTHRRENGGFAPMGPNIRSLSWTFITLPFTWWNLRALTVPDPVKTVLWGLLEALQHFLLSAKRQIQESPWNIIYTVKKLWIHIRVWIFDKEITSTWNFLLELLYWNY